MAESMKGLKRSVRCGEVTQDMIGQTLTLMGWTQKRRNLGSLIFVDLRDRSGLMQILFDETKIGAQGFAKAGNIRSEYVLAVTGIVQKRGGAVNEKLATGTMELCATDLRILSESQTPPFPVEENSQTKEELRLKNRTLDLRRPDLQRNLMVKSRVAQLSREFMAKEGFLEIETPMLGNSTPEGARDYLVPSRIYPGSFFALPQSPQLYKQLLMVAGYDRYFQLARCFRDEDLRADRQPEFTQMDMELSFVGIDDVIDVNERLLQYLWKEVLGIEISVPFRRMKWIDAMNRSGSDKPDLRFSMELVDLSDTVKDCGFGVFADCVKNGGYVRSITVKGQADMPRKKIDALTEFVRGYGLKGLAYIQLKEGGTKCSFAKFMTPEEIDAIVKAAGAETGDLVLIGADQFRLVSETMGALRCHLAKELGLIDRNRFEFLWVVEFPQFEWSEEENRFQAMHHPFTMPMEEDLEYLDPSKDLSKVRAEAYDIVLNGAEIGGGSVRIHQSDIQEKMFECLGFTKEQAKEQFSFLLNAFEYGVPPHAGLAYGLDRVVMMMLGLDSIRDVIAFPKVKDSSDLMTQAPGRVSEKQLEELGIAFRQDLEASE